MSKELTADLLRGRVGYDPNAGLFTWLRHPGDANGHRAWDKQWAGKPVFRRFVNDPRTHGRIRVLIRILGRWYGEGRLAWLYVHGRWPIEEIDHRDGDPLNNRLENLREATHAQNQMNKGPMRNNLLGIKGVYLNRNRPGRKKYGAQIRVPGTSRTKHIGWFATAEEASAAYQIVARQLHGSFLHQT